MEGHEINSEPSVHELEDKTDGSVHGAGWGANDSSNEGKDQGN